MSKIPVIFAPGMMCDHRLFASQEAALAGEREVGFADFSQDDTIAAMAERILASAPAQFYLAGLSMGGIVAFEVFRRARNRVAGLALLNTTPFADSPARRNTRLRQIERVRNGELRTVVMEELKPNYLSDIHKQDQNLLKRIYTMAENLGPEAFLQQTRALMGRADSMNDLPSIACSTLIIAGADDEVCPPELHQIMNDAMPASSLHVIEECGHLSTMETPAVITDLIRNHINAIEKM